MNEFYTSKACQLVNGQFRGIESTSDNSTKTIVAMVPLNKLDSSIMKKLFTLVVHQLAEIDIDPVSCLVDGHPTNRKCYLELCGGSFHN